MESTDRKSRGRAFTALMMTLSGIGLPVTGIANHVYGFSPMTTARHAWMTAHNVLGVVFVFFVIWHMALNRRALWNHVKGIGRGSAITAREAVLAGAVVALALLLVGHAFVVGE